MNLYLYMVAKHTEKTIYTTIDKNTEYKNAQYIVCLFGQINK